MWRQMLPYFEIWDLTLQERPLLEVWLGVVTALDL